MTRRHLCKKFDWYAWIMSESSGERSATPPSYNRSNPRPQFAVDFSFFFLGMTHSVQIDTLHKEMLKNSSTGYMLVVQCCTWGWVCTPNLLHFCCCCALEAFPKMAKNALMKLILITMTMTMSTMGASIGYEVGEDCVCVRDFLL